MINIAGKLISNKVNNIRFFLNYPKIDIEEENDHVQKFVELVNKSIKNEVDIFEEIVIMSDNNITRREEREQAFLICFEKLFTNSSIEEISECAEESRDDTYSDFAIKCADGVTQHVEEIDEIISSHLTGKWKIERLNKVSLGVMRLAVYELKYLDDIPANVTINEAVELSKKFSGEDEYKFVNGVLGAIARDL